MAPSRCRCGVLQPQAKLFENSGVGHAPGIERTVTIIEVDREAEDMPAAFGGAGYARVDCGRPPAGRYAGQYAGAPQQPVYAAQRLACIAAQFPCQLLAMQFVATHIVVAEF